MICICQQGTFWQPLWLKLTSTKLLLPWSRRFDLLPLSWHRTSYDVPAGQSMRCSEPYHFLGDHAILLSIALAPTMGTNLLWHWVDADDHFKVKCSFRSWIRYCSKLLLLIRIHNACCSCLCKGMTSDLERTINTVLIFRDDRIAGSMRRMKWLK